MCALTSWTLNPTRLARAVAICAMFLGAFTPATGMTKTVVRYDFSGFALLHSPPTLADLGTYKPRQFAAEVGASRAVSGQHNRTGFTCPLASQDAAKTGGAAPSAVPVVAFGGCPFDLPFIASERWIELREPITLTIASIRNGVVTVTPDSIVPFVAEPGRVPYPAPTAVGVRWRFERSGLRFNTPAGEFVTGNNGGTISFTKNGPQVRGFSQVPRLSGTVPSSNGWAKDAMRDVQERLTRLGFKPGPVDGVWGSRTREALVAFQRSAGLNGSGRLDGRTLIELGI
jgi:hypothetical protein